MSASGESKRRSGKASRKLPPAEPSEVIMPTESTVVATRRKKSVGVPLDERRRAEICAIVGVGCSQATAARYVGCTPGAISAAKKRIASFREEMLRAEAHHELVLVRRIHEAAAGPNGWRAAAWLLSRRYPERYAARAAETVTPQQIQDSLEYFAAQVAREVKDPSARSRIGISLRKATRKIAMDIRSRNVV